MLYVFCAEYAAAYWWGRKKQFKQVCASTNPEVPSCIPMDWKRRRSLYRRQFQQLAVKNPACEKVGLCILSSFLPWDAMHKHGLGRRVVCPSVCHVCVFRQNSSKHIFKFFSSSGHSTILVFVFVASVMAVFRQWPLTETKINFWPISGLAIRIE